MIKQFHKNFIAAALATAVLAFTAATRRVLWASRTIGSSNSAR